MDERVEDEFEDRERDRNENVQSSDPARRLNAYLASPRLLA